MQLFGYPAASVFNKLSNNSHVQLLSLVQLGLLCTNCRSWIRL